ncbi:single-stranded DNA-binding protein [Zongyangia hominis]|uniref:Single-stranded DNA-binding protein n=1 Tax=Zongyangia hominis TaxID=2763677 RepID=A0A926IAZ6_9FIRM|nr:single-stranded DNA-binding protein [Zongyangia hominis]MBC8569748.1 single-stranded DNA-binding protein [Zongyangia hominis]
MLNKAILVGRITADPELRHTPSNIAVTSFTVAVNRPYSKNAERQTDFIDIVAWRSTAEFVCRYFHKGNAIAIDGRIQVSNYTDKEGNKRRRFEVLADNVSFVEGKNASAASAAPSESAQPQAGAPVAFESGNMDDFEEIDLGDDLPF